MTADDPVLCRIEDAVATLTLNRPERLNALGAAMLQRLGGRIAACAEDRSIRAIVLTGAGKAFSAGQDLNERDPRKIDWPPDLEAIQKERYHPILLALAAIEKPVVVAVNGVAAGAGASLAFAGDIAIAARTARFILSFARVGLSVDAGGGWHLVKALGPARARALLMTGGELSAEAAERAGLVFRVVDDEALPGAARDLACALANGPLEALLAIRRAVASAATTPDFVTYLEEEARLLGEAGRDPDYREGVLAFLEKRPPRFGG